MAATLNPYLNFRGEAATAMEFYRSVLGGDLLVMRFGDMGGMGLSEDDHGLVMHAQLTSPAGTLMGADVPNHMEHQAPAGFSVSLSGGPEDEATLRGWWDGLTESARAIGAPLEKAPWGATFGMLVDRFGIQWLVNIADEEQA